MVDHSRQDAVLERPICLIIYLGIGGQFGIEVEASQELELVEVIFN